MKIATLLLAKALVVTTPEIPLQAPPIEASAPSPHFSYLSLGASVPATIEPRAFLLSSPDIYFGNRHFFNPHHAADYGFGFNLHLFSQLAYAQGSYLYYFNPNPSDSAYLGIGITAGAFHLAHTGLLPDYGPWINTPVTFGYQFSTKHNHKRLIQIQTTPLRTATISYGFGY